MGIRFVPKVLKWVIKRYLSVRTGQAIVRKSKRNSTSKMIGLVKKKRKKIKPGYRKKSNGQLMKGGEKLSAENRARGRAERRPNVQTLTPSFKCSEEHRFSL